MFQSEYTHYRRTVARVEVIRENRQHFGRLSLVILLWRNGFYEEVHDVDLHSIRFC